MQDQPRYEAYEAGDRKYFRDGKASRELIEGTVPRVAPGQPYVDMQADYLYTGRPTTAGSAAPQTTPQGAGGASQTGAQGVRANVPAAAGGTTQPAGAQSGPDVFPVKIDAAAVERGQERFNIYCSICHGIDGAGRGPVRVRSEEMGQVMNVKSVHDADVRARPEGHIFNTITNGIRNMPGYGSQIPVEDRWAIVAYVRALQASQNAPPNATAAADLEPAQDEKANQQQASR